MLENALLLAAVIVGHPHPYQTEITVTDENGAAVRGASVAVHAEIGGVRGDPIARGSTNAEGVFVTDELGPHKHPHLRGVYVKAWKDVRTGSRWPQWVGSDGYPAEISLTLTSTNVSHYSTGGSPHMVARVTTALYWDRCRNCYVRIPVAQCGGATTSSCSPCPPPNTVYQDCGVLPESSGYVVSGSITWPSTAFPMQNAAVAGASRVVGAPPGNLSVAPPHAAQADAVSSLGRTAATSVYRSVRWSNAEAGGQRPLSVDGWRASTPD